MCARSCPTPCDPMDCSLPGSSVEFSRQEYWSGLLFPTSTSWPRGWTCISCVCLHWQADSLPPRHLGSPRSETITFLCVWNQLRFYSEPAFCKKEIDLWSFSASPPVSKVVQSPWGFIISVLHDNAPCHFKSFTSSMTQMFPHHSQVSGFLGGLPISRLSAGITERWWKARAHLQFGSMEISALYALGELFIWSHYFFLSFFFDLTISWGIFLIPTPPG